MANLALTGILEKMTGKDKDYRYMATSDLLNELSKATFKADADLEVKLTNIIIQQLDDAAGDVSGLAVKCLAPLVRKVSEVRVVEMTSKLCDKLLNGKDQHRDIASIALKTVVAEVSTQSLAQSILQTLTPQLIKGITGPGMGSEIKCESLDILCDVLHKFGNLMAADHELLLSSLLSQLSSNQASVRKKTVACIASLSSSLSDDLLAKATVEVVSNLKNKVTKSEMIRTNIQMIGALSRAVGYRFGPHLGDTVPVLINYCTNASENDEELREYSLQALESFLLRCPRDISVYCDEILHLTLEYLSYDPNFTDNMEEDTDDEGLEEEEDDESANEYTDDEDVSWKVRRAAAKCLAALIVSRPEILSKLYDEACPKLIDRFKEREENVKMDVFNTFIELLRQTGNVTKGQIDANEMSPRWLLKQEVSKIVKSINRQLREKSIKTKVGAFSVLKELVVVLPNCLADHIGSLIPGIEKALNDKSSTSNLKIEALTFTRLVLSSHSPDVFHPYIKALSAPVLSAVGERYYKVTAEALRVCGELVRVVRPNIEGSGFDFRPYVQPIYNGIMSRLINQDQDQEVKECAISCMGLIVSTFGDHLNAELPACLPVLVDRMGNEITRLTAVKGSNSQSAKVCLAMNQNALSSSDNHGRALKSEEDKEEGEEEEDEDADFNPFLKENLSQEASSSLSSEVDGLDGNVITSKPSVGSELSKVTTKEQTCTAIDNEHGEEEVVLQPSGMISLSEINQVKHNDLTSVAIGNGSRTGELSDKTNSRSPVIDVDNEDAICMRTRARYSLASFTLDELETFLQETDDDDDLQNADDEEEYKKFLTAVLQGGDDGFSTHENENLDDDEDNDADFEIELEELLESDAEDNSMVKTRKEFDRAGRRPETRQNKRQKVSAQCEKKTLGEVKRPLRPILPNWLNGTLASGKGLVPEASLSFQSSASGNGLVNGFTPMQIGQLHCLIHEHIQLLIQVFSLSVLEPSQKQVASQVQGLLFEMLHKRDELLASKRVPYPTFCFSPSFSSSSVSEGGSKFVQVQSNSEEYGPPQDAHNVLCSQSIQKSSEGLNLQSCFQPAESSFWIPSVRGPVKSILDVSPLHLVRSYTDDINSAAQEFRKRYIESRSDSPVEKEPLFPFSSSVAEASSEISSGTTARAVNAVSTSPGQQQPKKTLAAMLVESTKKQSIALVPKEVAKLAQRFLALFNPALFPHNPPPAAVVNRILFTDSEDELLALGIMEYNTDWKAIQQRFLPCKSKHQIFVRQKNRCSSKASENPIKAVRRMKTSPLTAEEIACIQEGLKIYKFDWMSVWQYIVPHRDPSLLPRQWRIALGTQKSYKIDESKREKRRLYESQRRKLKAASLESWRAISDKEDCDTEIAGSESMDYSDVPYVHQAFLADWRPDTSALAYSERIPTTSVEGNVAHNAFPQHIRFYRGTQDYGLSGKVQYQNGNQSAFPSVSYLPQFFHTTSDLRNGMNGAPSTLNPKKPVFSVTSSSKYYCRPYRSRRAHNAHLVKLAPELPPVNLPPSVRVVSQTAFKGFQCGTSKVYPPGGGVAASREDHFASQIRHGEKSENVHPVIGAKPALKDTVTDSQSERFETVEGRSIQAEKGTCTDLEMHPLLFQVTEDGNVPYYPLKFSSGTSSSFSFFSGSQPQLNLSLFHSSQQQSHIDCANKSLTSKSSILRSGGIDFHPLLQKSGDAQSPNFDSNQPESLGTSGVLAIMNRSSGLTDKSNELDLEIHLSSVSGRQKSGKSRQAKAHDPAGSKKTVAISGIAREPLEDSLHCQQGGENVSASGCGLASSYPLVDPNDNIARYDVDDIGDQSHPEIVMEQEELSDSEEDIEEHVEFECEEMTDSEGEDGSGSEQAHDVQNKEVSISSEENVVKYMACMKKSGEPRANSDAQVDGGLFTNNTALTNEEQDDRSSSSWLSLDSCSAGNPVLSKSILGHSTSLIGEASASRNFSIGKVVTEERHTIDTVQQPTVGPHVSTTPRKPRKRFGKPNANLNIGLTVERSCNDGNHENG